MEENQLFPVFIKLNTIQTVLIGAGNVGLEKLSALLSNSPGANVKVIGLQILPELQTLADQYKNVTIHNREFSAEDLDGAGLVIAATNNAMLNEEIRSLATEKNLLANFADKPELCDFYLGSVVKKGNLKLAISTNGKSPTIAKRLKEVLNQHLPDELNDTLQHMESLRNTLEGDFKAKVIRLNEVTSLLVEEKNELIPLKDDFDVPMGQQLADISAQIKDKDPVEALRFFAAAYPGKIVFSTSFGWEDQVISHMIFANDIPIEVFTLETGRLFPETYYVWNRTLEIYNKPIKAYYPQAEALQDMVDKKGPNSFYESVDNRKQCCNIRKLEPLKRALNGNKLWVTGIRSEQSLNRHDMTNIEWDINNQMIKFHPLFFWSLDEVKAYIKKHNIVYNTLHDKGFPSIGCAPCTRAVGEGEDFRAGRWWWEDQSKKECGLHATK